MRAVAPAAAVRQRSLRVAFVHPDLGIGGSERLVVDAAVQLQQAGHEVVVFTTHHDRGRCFEETRDGTLTVRVYGDFLPTNIAGRLRAPCVFARMAVLAIAVGLRGGRFDVVFCDLVSHVIPLLRMLTRAAIVFYCHFPDQLLTPPRHSWYRLYRLPIDWAESVTTGMAERVLVNSQFTASVFRATFPRLAAVRPEVVSPGVDHTRYAGVPEITAGDRTMILSLNRFDPKKNLGLAVDAVAALRDLIAPAEFDRVHLVVAGSYDARLPDSREALQELQTRARAAKLDAQVTFRTSISDAERLQLLSQSRCVVYTPEYEHFGIVPLEAMAAGRPVVAVNNGGPTETIVDGETGFLRAANPAAFAGALAQLVGDAGLAARLGRAARAHVARSFSQAAFAARLNALLRDLAGGHPVAPSPIPGSAGPPARGAW